MKKMTKKKKLFRKVTALAAVIALGASLAGCGSSDGETTQRYSWPLATASPEDTVTQIFAEKFAEEISELSDGRMKIQVYANSTLGGDRDLLETCADGDIPFVVQNTAPRSREISFFCSCSESYKTGETSRQGSESSPFSIQSHPYKHCKSPGQCSL